MDARKPSDRAQVGDRVTYYGKEYVVVEVDEATDSASLVPLEDLVQDVPFKNIVPRTTR